MKKLRFLFLLLGLCPLLGANAGDKIGMDLSQRQFWHISRLIETLAKKGTISPDIPATAKQIAKDAADERTRLKKAYTTMGSQLHAELNSVKPTMSDAEHRDLVRKYRQAVGRFSHHGFLNQLKVYRLIEKSNQVWDKFE